MFIISINLFIINYWFVLFYIALTKDNYSLIKNLKIFIKENSIRNYIFLISAASLSNIIVYELFKECDENTYIDLGSTLNPLLGIDGWQGSRTYLKEYWENQKPIQYLNKNCYW